MKQGVFMKQFIFSIIIYFDSVIVICQINFSSPKVLSTSFWPRTSACIYTVDFDKDNDIDIIVASYSGDILIYVNNGKGEFLTKTIKKDPPEAMSVYANDLDGDGDTDIVAAIFSGIVWFENNNNEYGEEKLISSLVAHPNTVFAVDLDNDNDIDVLSGDLDNIAWYENTNGNGSFSEPKAISTTVNTVMYIYAADLDGDNDYDVLSASSGDNKIAWYENIDGKGNFSAQKIISNSASGAWSLFVADLDNDMDLDVISASTGNNRISWFENLDGKGTFSTEKLISNSALGARSVFSVDIDNDGDMDVLSASEYDDKITWYENLNKNSFSTGHVITTSADGAMLVCAADFDNDGDVDILSSSLRDYKILLFTNLSPTSVENDNYKFPLDFNLDQNYPNPFNPGTTISFSLPSSNFVELSIYNLLGEKVATLVKGYLSAGFYKKNFVPYNIAGGVYLYKLKIGDKVLLRKMMYVK